MSWIVLASGRFDNGQKVPDVIGPFMSPEAAHRCVARLHNLAMPGSAFGVQISEMVPPTTAYAKAATSTDLAYGGRAVDQWSYDVPADEQDPPPVSWGSGQKVEIVTGSVEYLDQIGRHAAVEARGMSVVPLDKDGRPIEVRRTWT